jgi:predicted  nucleic acid-binding Zn-ribbon protein
MARPKGSKNIANISSEDLDLKISAAENEITELTGKLKAKRTELKKLKKAKEKNALIAAAKKAEEDKAAILAAIEKSGKSVEEVLEMFKSK